ncbi:carbohydrate-binding protein [Paraprevotella xylaniphila]|uniref:carbohydrate-binding protein n=1 Tax=Paraprevotella xylaniphila TaxID=454155 RepID=UPI003AB5C6B8
MPSIYRESKGKERFYNAVNDKYKYDDETFYKFNNLYEKGKQHEAFVTFDDIYPTISNIKNASGLLLGEVADVAYDQDDSDALKYDSEDKNNADFVHSYFYIKLNIFDGEYGFNLFKQALESEKAKIIMTTGSCAPCEFEIGVSEAKNVGDHFEFENPVQTDGKGNIVPGGYEEKVDFNNIIPSQQDTSNYSVWIALKKENSTFGEVMPNVTHDIKVKKGDKFVITGINLPTPYILDAEKRLENNLIKQMKENNDEKFDFSVVFSRIFLAEHEDISSKLNENARINIEYNGQTHLLYVTNYSCKADDNILYEISIELAEKVSVQQNLLRDTISDVAEDMVNKKWEGIDVFAAGQKFFIRKDIEDSAKEYIIFKKGIGIGSQYTIDRNGNGTLYKVSLEDVLQLGEYIKNISGGLISSTGVSQLIALQILSNLSVSGNSSIFGNLDLGGNITTKGYIKSETFSTGALGSGFILGKNELTGDTYFEIDRMLVRKSATFIELIIQKLQHVGGQIILTPASMKCDSVAEIRDEAGEITAYRCFLNSSDGNTSVENQFVVGDFARAQTFNVKEGVNENVKNTYYWRLVTGVGDDYIDLSKTDCDAGSTVPAAGDEIVQLGNRNDAARQAAIILAAYGNDAPYIKMYRGINSYKLDGKEFASFSRKEVNIIADVFKWSSGESVKDYIDGSVGEVQDKVDEVSGKVEDAVERLAEQQNYIAALQQTAGDLQDQIDGAIESYFEKTDPTTSNYPANEWTTEEQKQSHSNDTYTNISTGKSWKWVKDGSTWKWKAIADTATEKALAAAAKAQDTADGKRRVFVSQPTTGQAYDVGDLWVNATYGETYKDDLLRCKTAKKENEAFSISHWELASRYTDDTKANEAAEAAREAAEAANAAQEAANEAAATAGEAKTEAQAANTELDNLKSDGTISPVEKTALKQQHADIKAEHGQITAEAGKYSISVADYEAAYKKADAALTKYTASTPEYITVESDYSDISSYYSERQTILDTIAAKAKEASDAAKKAADDAAAKAEEAAESASEAARKAIEAKTAADNAATAAKNAQADADEANSMLSDIANDNKLTAQEKQQAKKEWDVIVSEKPKNDASADKFGVSKTAYGSAYTALSTYVTPLLSDLSSTSNITGTEFRAKFKAYYDARTDLLNAISAKAKELADNAQEAADAAAENASQAIEDAASAKNAADKAQADVDAEKERMDDWAADGKFSPSEKKQLKEELARIDGDKTQVADGYTKYGLGTPTAYNTAYTNYRKAINGVVSSSSETVAIPSDFATKRTAYYTQKSAALTAISDAAKAYADKVVAGIEVGGRNILMETNQGKKRWYANTNEGETLFTISEWVDEGVKGVKLELTKKPSSWSIIYYNLNGTLDLLEPNTTYMLSFDVLSNISNTLSATIISSNATGKLTNSPSFSFEANKRKHVVLKLVTNDLSEKGSQVLYFYYNKVSYICFKNLKLEKGNVATAWTPAIEDVNGMIEDAQKAADDAAEAAKKAQTDATNANKELTNIKSDNLISPIEKTALKQQQADIRSEYGEITANAARYSVSTTAYKAAYDKASAALTKYTASSPEYITVGSDYANISAYYDARKTILDAIAAAAKKAADDATNKANQAVEDAARAGHYLLDLDNDSGQVACDADGNVTGGYPTTNAKVWYGTEVDTGWTFKGTFSGCTGSVGASSGAVTVTGMSKDDASVTVTATKSGKPELSAVFTVVKVRSGRDGTDGTNGVGIKSITNKYAVSASNTTAPTSWSDTVPTMTTTNRYLWNYEIVTYTNGTTSETKKRVIGAYGNTGNTGATGATGVGIKSITEYYLASSASSGVTTSTSGWTTSVQTTSSSKKYLWNYDVVTYTNDTKYTSSPVIIGTYGDKGDTGPQGVQGPKGADGTPRYTWIRYADNASGSGISNSPTGKTYIGFAYNKTTATESNTPSDYTWSLIKGEKGDTGVPGAKGADGKTTYTWIKYSDNSTGSGMYDTPKSTTQYIGIAVNKTTATESNTPSDYTWSKFKGDDGADGKGIKSTAVTYQASTSGTTPPTGTWSASVPSVAANQYLWTRTVITYTDNATSTSYSVGKMGANGAKGDKGDTGPAGADGDGIVSVSNTYQVGSSGTTAPTGSWSATVPSPQKGKYLWTKTVTTYKKSDPTTVYSVSYYGTDGTAAKYVRVAGDQVFVYANNFSGNPTPTSITLTATLTGTSGYQWSYKQAGQSSFTNISGATSQTYALAHNNSTVWGSAKSVTIRCTSGGVYDEITIAKVSSGTNGTNGKDGTNGTNGKDGAAGTNGADAYTIILGNESHAFQGTTSAAIAASTKCEVIAYKGATRVAATIGTITGAPSGMSTSISSNGTTSASFTVSVTSSLTTGQGVLTVPITVDGKSFTKNFSFSVAFKGNTGATGATGPKGDDAVFYIIETDVRIVKKSWDNKLTPTSVTCTKYKQTGSDARATTTEKTLKYQRVGMDSGVQTAASGSSVTVTPNSATTSIKFWLYEGSTIIDREEIPVVGDAVDVYEKVHAEIEKKEDSILSTVQKTYSTKDELTGLETTLGKKVSIVEQTAESLKTTVNGLNGKVSKLEQTDSSLTSRITSAEGKVSTIEQKVSSISLKVDGIEPVNLFRDGSFESGYNTFRTSGSGKDDVEVGISANGKVGKNAMMVKWPGKRTTVYLEQKPFVNPNATYTVSFWMYTNVATNYQAFLVNALDKNDNNLSVNDSTLNIEIPGTKWTQFIHRFTTPANTERLEFYFRASANVENGTISYIDGFMLLKGDYLDNIPSYFIPNDSVNGDTLLSTGIDIENKKVIVTSDQFVIQNNDGEVTASVNEDGVLSVGSGEFSGFIRTIPRIITKNTGDNGDVEFKDNYYQISLSNLYKGGFIYVDVESNSYAGDGIKLPLGLKYAGARVTIVNKYPAKRLIITTRHEALDPGYGDWSDDENNAMRLGGVQISHVEMGNVSTQGNNRFVELLAVPYYLDETIGSVKYQGQVEWVVLNNQEFTTANNTTGGKYAKFK